MDSSSLDYGSTIRADAGMADLDLELAGEFLGGDAAARSDADRPGEESVAAKLVDLGLIRGRPDACQVTNAALLLFARAPVRRWHAGTAIRVTRVAGTARILGRRQSVTWAGRADPPLARSLPDALRMTRDRRRLSEPLRDLLLQDTLEYPEPALREAVVNAVAHRDYERAPVETEVVFYDDRVEVTSPGLLAEGVAVGELEAASAAHATRNPLLVRALVASGHMSGRGEGLALIHREMKRSLLAPPDFSARRRAFSISLRNEPLVAACGPGWRHVVKGLLLDLGQSRILLSRPDGFTRREYEVLNRVPRELAEERIRDLEARGVVSAGDVHAAGAPGAVAEGRPAPCYYLNADLDSKRWFLEDRLPRLRAHFRVNPRLRSADYRSLCSVNVPTASREIALLVELGFLRVGGRGRSSHYLPTPGLRK